MVLFHNHKPLTNVYTIIRGDIVILDFNQQAGHEQKRRRPAVVISNKTFNNFTKMAIVCPITNTIKDFPLHINLNKKQKTTGTIMCEQLKTIDYIARNIIFCEKLTNETYNEVIDVINSFIE